MPDDTAPLTTGTPAPAESAAPPAQPSTPTLSPADLAAAEQKGKNAAYAEARRWAEAEVAKATAKKADPPSTSPATPSTAGLTMDDVEAAMEFAAEATRVGFSADQRALLKTLRSLEKPTDISAWVAAKAKVFNVVPPTQAAAAVASTQSTTMPPKPVVAPASSTPAPVSTVPSDQPDNPLNWTPEQLQAYRQQHYPYPENPGDPRNAAPRRLLAIKTRAQAAHLLIPLDRVNR
jgi:hypothetical protein